MRVTLAQTDPLLGDVEANLADARGRIEQARDDGADLVVFPELALHGYAMSQIEDRSVSCYDSRLWELSTIGPDVLIGFHEDGPVRAFNAAAYLSDGVLVHLHRKLYLPNYLAWEERKHFSPGQRVRAFTSPLGRMATLICNDAWQPVLPWLVAQDGAEVLLVPANSAATGGSEPLDAIRYWEELLRITAQLQQCWVIFCNRVGTEAGSRYWGGSCVLDPLGNVVASAPHDEPAQVSTDVDLGEAHRRRRKVPLITEGRLGLIRRELGRIISEGGDA